MILINPEDVSKFYWRNFLIRPEYVSKFCWGNFNKT